MFFGKKQSLIGLDIGSHTVKVAELESHPKHGHKLVNWGISAPLAEAIVDGEIMDRQLVVDAISNLLESRSITTRNVVAAVSGRAVIVKKITMNKLSAEDAQQAVYWEAE
jgi:type IV pilus assembly protein PilM